MILALGKTFNQGYIRAIHINNNSFNGKSGSFGILQEITFKYMQPSIFHDINNISGFRIAKYKGHSPSCWFNWLELIKTQMLWDIVAIRLIVVVKTIYYSTHSRMRYIMVFSYIFSDILSLALRAMANLVLLEMKQFRLTTLVFNVKVELQCLQKYLCFLASNKCWNRIHSVF